MLVSQGRRLPSPSGVRGLLFFSSVQFSTATEAPDVWETAIFNTACISNAVDVAHGTPPALERSRYLRGWPARRVAVGVAVAATTRGDHGGRADARG